jgi:polyferredoxin
MITKHPWFRLLRYGTQAAYAAMIAFAIMGQNFMIAIGLMVISFIGGAWFCGWLCPLGSAQEWLGKLGQKLAVRKLRVPHKVERVLMFSRYVLLVLSFTGLAATAFLSSPYNRSQAYSRGMLPM